VPVEVIEEKYWCNICSSAVMVARVGGGTHVCYGENRRAAQTEDTMQH